MNPVKYNYRYRMTGGITAAAALLLTAASLFVEPCAAQENDHLSRAIGYYLAGRQTEALAELSAVVSADPHRPLAYYYAARIRLEQGELARAEQNLQTALRDSAGFADAAGVMAVILDRGGDSDAARDWWQRFTRDAGTDDAVNAETIMMPDTYRARLAEAAANREEAARQEQERREAAQREAERLETARLEREREEAERREQERLETHREEARRRDRELAAQREIADSLNAAEEAAAGDSEFLIIESEIEEEVDAIGNRVHASIRRGLYGIVSAVMLLIGGIAGIALYMRNRRRMREVSLGFAEEIDTALRERLEEEAVALELTGEDAERTFTEQSRRIRSLDRKIDEQPPQILEPPLPASSTPEPEPTYAPPEPSYEAPAAEPLQPTMIRENDGKSDAASDEAWTLPREHGDASHPPRRGTERPPITEEVKALVTRMSREGRDVNDICRTADLTRTEVELIIAVRARHTENLVLDYAREREEDADADRLYDAVRELAADGETEIGIARKLGISRSEAAMAIKVMKKWR